MTKWRDHQILNFSAAKLKREQEKKRKEWDGNCHGCQLPIKQGQIATIGPYWICDSCISQHFPKSQYTTTEACKVLEKIRGFK